MTQHKSLPSGAKVKTTKYKPCYYGGKALAERHLKPGLFLYSGLGVGSLFLSFGEEIEYVSCTRSEACSIAGANNMEYKFIDSFEGYNSTYVGD